MIRSLQVLKTLADTVVYLKKKHPHINSKKGVYALKLLRHPDGTRVPFEEMRGVRIKEFTIYDDNTLIVEQNSHGYAFKEKYLSSFDARLYLPNLAMINIYDYTAEFLTIDMIDFTYIEQTKQASVVMMSEWINNETGVLRAQWFMDNDIDKVLSEIGLTDRCRKVEAIGRNIDLDRGL